MNTPKTKPNAVRIVRPSSKAGPDKGERVQTVQQKQFSAVVGSIAKRYGVKVASASVPTKNPYAMSPEQSAKVSLQAGITTRAGNLKRTFK